MAETIIVADDDDSVRDALEEYLGEHGYDVRTVADGERLAAALRERPADLLILDVMMPGESGLDICRRLAPSGQLVLVLSAMSSTIDRVIGLELGASDYLAKPFDPRELLARVRAILRRHAIVSDADAVYGFHGWRYDVSACSVTDARGRQVDFTRGEVSVLRALLERPGRVVSRDDLLQLARGRDSDAFDRAIDLAISRLRRKLAAHGGDQMIETIRGEGYRFVPAVRRL